MKSIILKTPAKITTEKTLSEIGRRGGSVKSEKKIRAARENGRKGGRPKKGNKK